MLVAEGEFDWIVVWPGVADDEVFEFNGGKSFASSTVIMQLPRLFWEYFVPELNRNVCERWLFSKVSYLTNRECHYDAVHLLSGWRYVDWTDANEYKAKEKSSVKNNEIFRSTWMYILHWT